MPLLNANDSLRLLSLLLLAGHFRALQTKITRNCYFCLAATNNVLYSKAIMAPNYTPTYIELFKKQ